MVAGGGASVVYADTISDLGYGKELANYGEYSGDPNEALTFEYAHTILDLMTKSKYSTIVVSVPTHLSILHRYCGVVSKSI